MEGARDFKRAADLYKKVANKAESFKTDDPAAKLTALMAERYPVYAEADLTVLSRDVPHEAIVEEIVAALRERIMQTGSGA